MVDYLKLWIYNPALITGIIDNPIFDFKGVYSLTDGATEYPITAKWQGFEIKIKSKTWLEISGSIHNYWNGGTNENDFYFDDVKQAIKNLCGILKISPTDARIINLEIGVNICPLLNAGEIMDEIICYRNKRPLRPYEALNPNFYFIEFASGDHFLKVYDKGKQFKTKNILRVEYKLMRSREFNGQGVYTLSDLMRRKVLQVLGMKIMHFFKDLVFTDGSIDSSKLTKKDREIFTIMENPNRWAKRKGNKTRKSTTKYRKEKRFVLIVKEYGTKNHYKHLEECIRAKVEQLLKKKRLQCFHT